MPAASAAAAARAASIELAGDGLPGTADASVDGEPGIRMGGQAIALAGVIVVAGVILSRLLGWVRTSVFYAQFGVSPQLDAFYAAFRIPDTLFQLVAAGAVGSALVPVASELIAKGEGERARRVVSTIGNLMVVTLIPLAALLWLAAPLIVPLIAPIPSTEPEKLATTIRLTQLMLVSPILLAFGAVVSAGLNAFGVFGAPSLAPNVYNVAIIVCAIVLVPVMGVDALAVGVVVGAIGHVGSQALAARRHRLYRPVFDTHDPAVRETIRLLAPRALGLGATQLVFLVNTFFALSLGDGPNAIFTGAFTALLIPVGLIGVPLGIVLLPPLSQAIATGETERFHRLADQSLRLLLFVVVPLTALAAVLASPAIALLYQHGSFTAANTATMTPVFLVLLVGLVAHVAITLLAPIFYASKDTRTPVSAALLFVVVDVGSAILLFPAFHLEGLALAMGLGAFVETGTLAYLMERRLGLHLRPLVAAFGSYLPGGVLAAAAAFAGDRLVAFVTRGSTSIPALIVELGLASALGVAAYVAWSKAIRLAELDSTIDLVRGVTGRFRRA